MQEPTVEITTVPGAITSSSGYLCFIERESLPVGIFIPKATAKSEQASTAWYNRASSPSLLQAHIQLAERLTPLIPSSIGAKTRLESASPMAFRDPAAGSTRAVSGECPMVVA